MIISVPTTNGRQIKINFKKLFFPLLIFIVVVIVIINFSELREIGELFKKAKWYFILAAFASQFVNFFFQASVIRSTFRILGFPRLKTAEFMKVGIMVFFLNFVIPSLGMAGYFNFAKVLEKYGVKIGRAANAAVIEVICYYLAFVLVIIFSLFYLFFKLGHIGYSQIIAAGGLFLAITILTLGISFFVKSKKASSKVLGWVANKIDYFEDGVHDEKRIQEILTDFRVEFAWIKDNKLKLAKPFGWQLMKFITDGVTIFLIFLAFGFMPPIGLGLVAFAFGRMFGLLSFMPGGVGAFEGAMVLIFNSLGVSLELALSVMLIYRFFSYWLYFPLGLWAQRSLNRNNSN